MEYEIFTAEIPPAHRGSTGEPGPILLALRKLALNECFVVPNATRNQSNNVHLQARRVGIKVTTRKVAGGLQVWRIE